MNEVTKESLGFKTGKEFEKFMEETMEFNEGRNFVKAYGVEHDLIRNLAGMSPVIFVLLECHVLYNSNIIAFSNGVRIREKHISEILGISKSSTLKSLSELVENNILKRKKDGRSYYYIMNPYIVHKGKCVEKYVYDMFDDYRKKYGIEKGNGFYSEYKKYISSPEWRKKRVIILKRDNNMCVMCGSKENLNVHHLTYERLYEEDNDDLVTLCSKCHKDIHERKDSND